jgi:hypothetical protein
LLAAFDIGAIPVPVSGLSRDEGLHKGSTRRLEMRGVQPKLLTGRPSRHIAQHVASSLRQAPVLTGAREMMLRHIGHSFMPFAYRGSKRSVGKRAKLPSLGFGRFVSTSKRHNVRTVSAAKPCSALGAATFSWQRRYVMAPVRAALKRLQGAHG